MGLIQIHEGLARSSTLFIGALALWALFQRVRSMPLGAAWYGAAVVGEIVIIAQALVGIMLYFQGLGVALPRPFMHILYGTVAVITLPAAYSYFGHLEDEKVKALALALVCAFLWGILLRATSVAQPLPVGAVRFLTFCV